MASQPNISLYNELHARGTLSRPMCSIYFWKFFLILIKNDSNIRGIEIFSYCYLYPDHAGDTTWKKKILLLIFLTNSSYFLIFQDWKQVLLNAKLMEQVNWTGFKRQSVVLNVLILEMKLSKSYISHTIGKKRLKKKNYNIILNIQDFLNLWRMRNVTLDNRIVIF